MVWVDISELLRDGYSAITRSLHMYFNLRLILKNKINIKPEEEVTINIALYYITVNKTIWTQLNFHLKSTNNLKQKKP